ncbi:MAG: hypothetical protein ACTHLE_07025 [Agriterribacter sp.]
MKKLLVILAIGAFAACNNATESTETPAVDTTTVTPAPEAAPVTPDTTAAKTDTTAAADTTKK